MKREGEEKLKILLNTGSVVELYVDQNTLEEIKINNFLEARDDNSTIWIAPRSISAFEVINEQKENVHTPPTGAT